MFVREEQKMKEGSMGRKLTEALAAASIGGEKAGGAGFGTSQQEEHVKIPQKWDKETDVLVVGYGYAGAVSALSAKECGAKTLIIEKEAYPAGGSPASGGNIGIVTDVEKAFTYFKRLCGGRTPDNVIRAFCEEAYKIPDYLKELASLDGAKIGKGIIKWEGGVFDFQGREAYKSMAIISVPGFTNFPWYPGPPTGVFLTKVLMDNVEAKKIEVMFSTPAKRLLIDATGAVIGVIAENKGGRIAIKARKAVILACGGFEQNEEMRKQFFQGMPFVTMCHPSNTGDGIRMAQKVGAGLWHMWHIHGSYGFWYPELGKVAIRHNHGGPMGRYGRETKMVWIVVDKFGRRYMNEFPPMPADLAHRPMQLIDGNLLLSPFYKEGSTGYPRIPSWLIFDEEGRKLKRFGTARGTWSTYKWSRDNSEEVKKGWIIKADTLKELSEKIKADPENDRLMEAEVLENTVSRWNEIVANGKIDPDFRRGPQSMSGPIATPPYYAAKVWPLITNTQGGPVHNAKQQVLDSFEEPISRLYAVGELGSMFGHLYETMGNIAECFTSGRISGRNAAAEKPWE